MSVDQAWDAIKRVGFTPGETQVALRGNVKGARIEAPEIDRTFDIEDRAPEGDAVGLKGALTPPSDPRAPVIIRIVSNP